MKGLFQPIWSKDQGLNNKIKTSKRKRKKEKSVESRKHKQDNNVAITD